MQVLDDVIHIGGDNGIKAGHRLVEKQELLRGAQRARQQDALLLTAGEVAVAALSEVGDSHALHIPRRQFLFLPIIERPPSHAPLAAGQDDFPHGGRKIPLHVGLLGQVADFPLPQTFSEYDVPGKRRVKSQKRLHQRGFARAVFADDAEIHSGLHGEGQIFDDGLSPIAEGKVFAGDLRHYFSASFNTSRFFRMTSR